MNSLYRSVLRLFLQGKPVLPLLLSAVMLLFGCGTSDDWYYTEPQSQAVSIDDLNTGLPRVDIRTADEAPIVSRTTWLTDAQMTIYNADGTIDYQGTMSIRGRGNFTWELPKKPYALKLNKKGELLGMPRHKRWCLLSNWLDRTMMRNAVAFEISRGMSALEYTPRGKFVEVFINGKHQGNYYLCEHIKIDAQRVPVNEADPGIESGLGVTGGFLFEVDDHFDEPLRFMSPRASLPWQLKEPDDANSAQFDYVKQLVTNLEDALYDDRRFARRDFAQLMELSTFADWWIVHELTMNTEVRHPRSCFMYKDMDTAAGISKIKAGPVWDFDCWTFNPRHTNQFTAVSSMYYLRLFQDEQFRSIVKYRWQLAKDGGLLENVCRFIDVTEQQLILSDQINSRMWPITRVINPDTFLSFHDATKNLKAAFVGKYYWLDNAISDL